MAPKDGKPRGRMSAYAFFVQTFREEHKRRNPNENVVFAEFSKKCAEKWKTMSEKEKARFVQMADKDKKRYDGEMAHYVPPKGEKGGRGKKRTKDPNAPKRALSAFFWFCNDERPKVKATMPDASIGDIAKVLGKRWQAIGDDVKARYEALNAKDKARYEKEIAAYKGKGGGAKKASPAKGRGKAAAAVESDDDDDDDEEDDDDDDDDDD